MNHELKVILTAREAAEYLRVSLFTLSKMEKLGMLSPARTPGGHRRYTLEMLNAYLDGHLNPKVMPVSAEARADDGSN